MNDPLSRINFNEHIMVQHFLCWKFWLFLVQNVARIWTPSKAISVIVQKLQPKLSIVNCLTENISFKPSKLVNLLQGMFDSVTYNTMFEELLKGAVETGPFDRSWSNVPVVKDHALQVRFRMLYFDFTEIKIISNDLSWVAISCLQMYFLSYFLKVLNTSIFWIAKDFKRAYFVCS